MDLNLLPRPERLGIVVDWVFGRLPDPKLERALTEAAPREPGLRAEIEWARGLRRVARDLPLTEPPALLRQRLRQQFRAWAAGQGLPAPPALELNASLVFDSRRDRLEVGVRGDHHDGEVTHLVWRTEVAELIIQARTQDSGLVRLDGQVLLAHPTSSPVFEIVAQGPGVTLRAAEGDSLGRFHALVPQTVDRLYVSNGEVTLTAQISLGGS